MGVVDPQFRVVYSQDETLFYIHSRHGKDFRPRYWFGVEKIPGVATDEMKAKADSGGIFSKPIVEFKINSTGETYCRQALPFTFWKVKSGIEKPISQHEEAFKDYASFHNWPAPKRGCRDD
jgi:hypothetical protein